MSPLSLPSQVPDERKGRSDFNFYTIYFERQPLDGLQIGADVSMRGIKVGRVEDYALADDKLNRVRVEVRIDRRAPVRTNTVAVVSRNYITSIATIALVTLEPPGAPLEQVPAGELYPVNSEGRSGVDEVASRVVKVGDMASLALSNVNQLLSADNRDMAMATVRSLRDLPVGLQIDESGNDYYVVSDAPGPPAPPAPSSRPRATSLLPHGTLTPDYLPCDCVQECCDKWYPHARSSPAFGTAAVALWRSQSV